MKLGPHVASLGMRFYTGTMFPAEYRSRIFIAEHGSWNRSVPIGYRITLVRLEGGRAVSYEVFAEGWLQGGRAWGRPVDVLRMTASAVRISFGCVFFTLLSHTPRTQKARQFVVYYFVTEPNMISIILPNFPCRRFRPSDKRT